MRNTATSIGWALVFAILAALAVPWFLWGVDSAFAGLPVWLWWHIAWMGLTAAVFYVFTRSGWGMWTGTDAGQDRSDSEVIE